jgi:hypothetical protein
MQSREAGRGWRERSMNSARSFSRTFLLHEHLERRLEEENRGHRWLGKTMFDGDGRERQPSPHCRLLEGAEMAIPELGTRLHLGNVG